MLKALLSLKHSDKSKMAISVLLFAISIVLAYSGTHLETNGQSSGSPLLAMLMVVCLYASGLLYKSCKLSKCEL